LSSLIKYTKNFCHNNPDIIFTRADKGNTMVVFNKNTYINIKYINIKYININI